LLLTPTFVGDAGPTFLNEFQRAPGSDIGRGIVQTVLISPIAANSFW
jgi:hypothetical protein